MKERGENGFHGRKHRGILWGGDEADLGKLAELVQ
jgi:hypothetical protein